LTDFVAIYRGRTISEAELLAVTAERQLVRCFFAKLLGEEPEAPAEPEDRKATRELRVVRD
jgi:hypothetical protein